MSPRPGNAGRPENPECGGQTTGTSAADAACAKATAPAGPCRPSFVLETHTSCFGLPLELGHCRSMVDVWARFAGNGQ